MANVSPIYQFVCALVTKVESPIFIVVFKNVHVGILGFPKINNLHI
jgi:hypothetical protein